MFRANPTQQMFELLCRCCIHAGYALRIGCCREPAMVVDHQIEEDTVCPGGFEEVVELPGGLQAVTTDAVLACPGGVVFKCHGPAGHPDLDRVDSVFAAGGEVVIVIPCAAIGEMAEAEPEFTAHVDVGVDVQPDREEEFTGICYGKLFNTI